MTPQERKDLLISSRRKQKIKHKKCESYHLKKAAFVREVFNDHSPDGMFDPSWLSKDYERLVRRLCKPYSENQLNIDIIPFLPLFNSRWIWGLEYF